jgi:hypothetical protein
LPLDDFGHIPHRPSMVLPQSRSFECRHAKRKKTPLIDLVLVLLTGFCLGVSTSLFPPFIALKVNTRGFHTGWNSWLSASMSGSESPEACKLLEGGGLMSGQPACEPTIGTCGKS